MRPPAASIPRSAFAGARTLLIATLPLVAASTASAQALPEMRLTPAEIRGSAVDGNQIGVFVAPPVLIVIDDLPPSAQQRM